MAVKTLKKEIENLEKQIEALQSESSTSETSSTSGTSNTSSTNKTNAQQDQELLQKMGPAYTTSITDEGYAASQAEQQQKKTEL